MLPSGGPRQVRSPSTSNFFLTNPLAQAGGGSWRLPLLADEMPCRLQQDAGDCMTQVANAAVATYDGPQAAVTAIRQLEESGFDMAMVSVAVGDERSGNQVTGCHGGSEGMQHWDRLEQSWGPLWGLLSGWAFFEVPGIGPVLVAGPLAGWLVAALNNAALFGDLSALGAALYNIGVARDTVLACEAAAKACSCIVLVYGTTAEVRRARQILTARSSPAAQADGTETGTAVPRT